MLMPDDLPAKADRTDDTANATKPNHKNAVEAWASWHRFLVSGEPLVILLLFVYDWSRGQLRVSIVQTKQRTELPQLWTCRYAARATAAQK